MYNVGEFSFLVYASNGPESVAVSKGELRISFFIFGGSCFLLLFVCLFLLQNHCLSGALSSCQLQKCDLRATFQKFKAKCHHLAFRMGKAVLRGLQTGKTDVTAGQIRFVVFTRSSQCSDKHHIAGRRQWCICEGKLSHIY